MCAQLFDMNHTLKLAFVTNLIQWIYQIIRCDCCKQSSAVCYRYYILYFFSLVIVFFGWPTFFHHDVWLVLR